MVSLKAAKCPSCGADIEVNPDLEKGICQFCGSTILIQDAIQKIKVEHTGTIKIDGIQGEEDILDIAKKHVQVGDIASAYEAIEEILYANPYNLDTIKLYLELREKDIRKYLDMNDSDFACTEMMTNPPEYYLLFKERFSNLEKLDTNNNYADTKAHVSSLLNELNEKFERAKAIRETMGAKNEYNSKISREIVDYLNKCASKKNSSANRLLRSFGFARSQCDFNNSRYLVYHFTNVTAGSVSYQLRNNSYLDDNKIYTASTDKLIPVDEKLKLIEKAKKKEVIIQIIRMLISLVISFLIALTADGGMQNEGFIGIMVILFLITLPISKLIIKKIY